MIELFVYEQLKFISSRVDRWCRRLLLLDANLVVRMQGLLGHLNAGFVIV